MSTEGGRGLRTRAWNKTSEKNVHSNNGKSDFIVKYTCPLFTSLPRAPTRVIVAHVGVLLMSAKQVEQMAYAPSNMIPGVEPSPDKMLQVGNLTCMLRAKGACVS